ncbi:S8 family peptidase [Deinococcus radiotolerans]|uniref:Peptidase S8/S53 domain-containing protein n=1 Tax=Deinococcus radiotolerans TaxID=1309407 RepID=A0ABQ2FNG2_9DEIO|nr:S8/S53 family peptidase [Deinococcus radiotolerans]GGL11277.1 hypothetical protein GCM10010844_32450 [Deinococcus radiotolerans]
MRLRLISLALTGVFALTACGGGTTTPPNSDPPKPPTPGISDTYLPKAGFWDGQTAQGPWCKSAGAQSLGAQAAVTLNAQQVQAMYRTPTPGMRALSGLSPDLQGLGAQRVAPRGLALLLPTGAPADQGLSALNSAGVQINDTFGGYWLTADLSPAQASTLIKQGLIQYAEPLQTRTAVGLPTPTDANLINQDTYLPMMNTQAAWSQLEPGCAHPVIAVIDTGWNGSTTQAEYNLVPKSSWYNAATHTAGDAAPNVSGNFADHGTAVAGVIALTTNGYGDGAGIGYNLLKVQPINGTTSTGDFSDSSTAKALMYAMGSVTVNGQTVVNPYPANIINTSWGTDATLSPPQFLQSYFDYAAQRGIVVVAAVGNELVHGTTDTAGLNHSIGAAGVMFNGERWVDPYRAGKGSNYGPGVDVAAPAMAVPTITKDGPSYWSGTSMSSPWVAAQIGLWMYANQQYAGSKTLKLTGDALYDKLSACFAATGSTRGVKDEFLGYGKLDTARLVSPTETACR